MRPIFILARDHREAQEMARRYELAPREWRQLGSDRDLRGYRKPQVIETECWHLTKGWRQIADIQHGLRWSEAVVAFVPCRV